MKKFLSLLEAKEGNWTDYINSFNPDGLHLDVMDGHAVNNLGLPLWIIPSLPKLPVQVHLMVNPVELFVEMTIKYKPDLVFFHPKWSADPLKFIDLLNSHDIEVGIAWDDDSERYFNLVDTILCMTVTPGKSGQRFLSERLEKIRGFAKIKKIWLDGGINQESIKLLEGIKLEGVVVGSAAREIFDSGEG